MSTVYLHPEGSFQVRAHSAVTPMASTSTSHEQYRSFRRRFCIPAISFGNLPFSASVTANHYPVATQEVQLQLFTRPEWQILPYSTESSDSPLDSAFTSFRRAAAQIPPRAGVRSTWLHNGAPLIDATLLFRERRPEDPLSAEAWASEFCRTFPIPWCIKLAGVLTSTRLMQWLLDPTPQTYAALPEMMRPTPRQRLMSHAPAIDAIPSPLLRDALIENPRDFVMPGIRAGCHVSWIFSLNEALIAVRRTEGESSSSDTSVFLSPEFCAHVAQAQNWKVGKKILTDLPELHTDPCVSSTQDTLVSPSYWL